MSVATSQLELDFAPAEFVPVISANEWREFTERLARDRKKGRENPCPTLAPIEWFKGVYA